jgi:hypothetical protein
MRMKQASEMNVKKAEMEQKENSRIKIRKYVIILESILCTFCIQCTNAISIWPTQLGWQ